LTQINELIEFVRRLVEVPKRRATCHRRDTAGSQVQLFDRRSRPRFFLADPRTVSPFSRFSK
jgi:hypothetical protein